MENRADHKNSLQWQSIVADCKTLAEFVPRNAVIQAIREGRFADVLDWCCGDAFVAAWGCVKDDPEASEQETARQTDLYTQLPIDEVLGRRARTALRSIPFDTSSLPKDATEREVDRLQFELMRPYWIDSISLACQEVDHYGESPLEIALRECDAPTFAKALNHLTEPARNFAAGKNSRIRGSGWTSFKTRLYLAEMDIFPQISLNDSFTADLIALALILGKTEHAEVCLRKGWVPDDGETLSGIGRSMNAVKALGPEFAKQVLQIENPKWDEAKKWLYDKEKLGGALDDVLEEFQKREDWRKQAVDILDKSPPISAYALTQATVIGDLNLLQRLFELGGNPNATLTSGMQVLCGASKTSITPEIARLWLERGANPTHHPSSEEPFGSEFNPSVLRQWACMGRVDLFMLAKELAAGALAFHYPHGRKNYSPLLAETILQNHDDLTVWLYKEGGIPLRTRDESDDAVFFDKLASHVRSAVEANPIGEATAAGSGEMKSVRV